VDEADLVSIHEAWIAHHVAAVREINREHRSAAILYSRGTMVMEFLVVVRQDVAAREYFFEVARKFRVH
jgi:hypothetical protein